MINIKTKLKPMTVQIDYKKSYNNLLSGLEDNKIIPMLYGADDWGDDDEFFEQSSKSNAKESSEPNENNKSNINCIITSSIFFGLSSIIIYKIL